MKIKPSHLPELVHSLSAWQKKYAGALWEEIAKNYTEFFFPHGVQGFEGLARFHASTLDNPYTMYVGKDATYLASKTEMDEFYLSSEYLPADRGFVFWQVPIGGTESRTNHLSEVDSEGNISQIDIGELMEEYERSPIPVVAASWRKMEGNKVLVTFYSDGPKAAQAYAKAGAQQVHAEWYSQSRMSDPLPLEREQVIPLDTKMEWMAEYGKETDSTLPCTVSLSKEKLALASWLGSKQEHIDAYNDYLPMLNQMVKTFVSTLMIRKMKMADVSTTEVTPKVRKRMKSSGASEGVTKTLVSVVRVGQLKRRQGASQGRTGTGTPWSVKTIVGPVQRDRQYIPATGEYDYTPRLIEPYIAGPEDAPWSKNARVYLLE